MRLLIVCAGLVLLAAMAFLYLISRNEVEAKSVYADLQFAEVDGRSAEGGVLHKERNGRNMAGLETREGGRVWVYLGGVDEGGGIYSVPAIERVGVECRLVEDMISSRLVDHAVSSALRTMCMK